MACSSASEEEASGDEQALAQGAKCVKEEAPAGTHEITNISLVNKLRFNTWLTRAYAVESRMRGIRQLVKLEKIIREDDHGAILQATARHDGRVDSWVIFWKGAEMKWRSGRYELPLGKSLLINRTAGEYDQGDARPMAPTYDIVSEAGEVLASDARAALPFFVRLDPKTVFAIGPTDRYVRANTDSAYGESGVVPRRVPCEARTCTVQSPSSGYVLDNVPPRIQQLFDKWMSDFAAHDTNASAVRAQLKVESIIRDDGRKVVFQATAVTRDVNWSGVFLDSWVVFWTGTEFRTLVGRYLAPVGTSLIVNESEGGYMPTPGYATHSKTWNLVSKDGAVLQSLSHPEVDGLDFVRVTDDVIIGSRDTRNYPHRYAFFPDRIANLMNGDRALIPCEGYKPRP